MSNLRWRYSELKGGMRQGISNAAIEGFAGNRIGSLTREICQNSLDAKDIKVNGPVIIQFKEFLLDRSDFPDVDGLTKSFEYALLETKKLKDQKAYNSIKKSLNIIKDNKIRFLRISDFNTTGLDGINTKSHSSWNNLVSAEGISDKDSSAGGSFGIGKNASFAASDLRTVFYSTLNEANERATTAVANLPSYDLEDGESFTQGPEFLGIDERNSPYLDLINLDINFKREKKGTDIYISGFIDDDNELNIIKELLNNYLYAIFEESLIVEVNDKVISKKNIFNLLETYKNDLEVETIELYQLLTSSEVKVYHEKVKEENDIEIRIILNGEGSRSISMIRKPWMKVLNQKGFKRHFSFFGTCFIKGQKLNELLRKAENPLHNQWEPDRVLGRKNEVADDIKKIKKIISDILENLHEIDVPETLDVFGAGDFIPLDSDGNQKAQDKVEEIVLDVEIKPIYRSINKNMINEYKKEGEYIIDSDGNVDIEVFHEPVNEHSKTSYENKSKTIKPIGKRIDLDRRAVRVISDNNNKGIYTIIFMANRTYEDVNMKLIALDEQGNGIKNILKLKSVIINNNELSIQDDMIYNLYLTEGLNRIKVETNLNITVSMGVEIYEN